jgi:hypothetical protein
MISVCNVMMEEKTVIDCLSALTIYCKLPEFKMKGILVSCYTRSSFPLLNIYVYNECFNVFMLGKHYELCYTVELVQSDT